MKLSELKQIIMECISEVLEEGGGTRARKVERRLRKGYKWDEIGWDKLDPKSSFGGKENIRARRNFRDKHPEKPTDGGTVFIAKRMGGPKNSYKGDAIKNNYDHAAEKAGTSIKNTFRKNRKLPG